MQFCGTFWWRNVVRVASRELITGEREREREREICAESLKSLGEID